MDTLKQDFQKILKQSAQDGVRVELLVTGGESLAICYQKRKLDSFESTQTQMAGFRVIDGANQGYAYTENLSEESLLRTYKEALNNAKTLQSESQLKIPLIKPGQALPKLDVVHASHVAMADKLKVAEQLEELCLKADPRVQTVPYSSFDEATSFKRVLNSEGLDQEFRQNYFSGYAVALAKEGESSKMAGESFFARKFEDINVDAITKKSVSNAVSLLGAEKPTTGIYPVVIDRGEFTTVMAMFISYLSAKNVDEGKSLFKGKLGTQVASSAFNLVDDPFDMRGTGVRPFDDEGAVSQKTPIFENGVLKNFLTNLEYAQKMNLPHTAHAARSPASAMDIGPTNLVVAKGDKSLEQLLSSYPKVIYLTSFSGGLHAGFKSTTGDISMPAEGFLYENGKRVGPIDQFIMSGNVLELLANIEAVGNEYNFERGGSLIAPDVLVKAMSFAGK